MTDESARWAGEDWTEARERVFGYLAAHRVASPAREELAEQILLMARDRAAAEPGWDPVELALDSAMQLIDGWIEHIVGNEAGESPDRRFAHERAVVHLAQLPRRWPGYFLSSREVPAEMAEHLRTTYVAAGPDLEFSSMAPRPIDLGPVSDVADTTWRTFDKWPLLRGLATWALYLALLALAFYAVRM